MIPEDAGAVKIVLFEVRGRLYGVDATQVLRIDQAEPDALDLLSIGRGAAEVSLPKRSDRALVFRQGDVEGQLRVDAIHGLRQIRVEQLRRIPAPARPAPCALGIWLDDEKPVVLIQLSQLSQEGGR